MFNKIQPEQIQLHTFSSPSGHLEFTQGESTVKLNLKTGLSGNFNFIGDFFLNGGRVLRTDGSNTAGGTSNNALFGQSNLVTGTSCAAGGQSNQVSGTRNAIFNGNANQIFDSATDATILAGYGGNITHNGAVLITDSRVETKNSLGTNTINIDFENGAFMQSSLYIKDDLRIGNSGLVSGSFNVEGTLLVTGKEVVNAPVMTGFVRSVSGYLADRVTDVSGFVDRSSGHLRNDLFQTGADLAARIDYDLDDLVRQTGNQEISGNKQFFNNIKLNTEVAIVGTGSQRNAIILEDDLAVDISTGKNLTIESLDSIILLSDTNGDGSTAANSFNPVSHRFDNSLIFAVGNGDPDSALTKFAVHPSGIGWFKDSIILDYPNNRPTSSTSDGISGQIVWERVSNDLGYLKLYDGQRWIRFTGVSF